MKIHRSPLNPLFTPKSFPSSRPGCQVMGVINPGAFEYNGRIGLILRVAERPVEQPGEYATLVWDARTNAITEMRLSRHDPLFKQVDPRACFYGEKVFLSTMSHLTVVWSDDGEHFSLDDREELFPSCAEEGYGIEDCRVNRLGDTYVLTYTACGEEGHAVGMRTTRDWKTFSSLKLLLPPPNKDCCVFRNDTKEGLYYMLHRPEAGEIGGNAIWYAESHDLVHWGNHRRLIAPREGSWDSVRIGAGAAPILTERGWLELYHGANRDNRYCMGLLLLDRDDPSHVLARSESPFLEPETEYERHGFCGQTVFCNGLVQQGDNLLLYYGAADSVTGMVRLSLKELLTTI